VTARLPPGAGATIAPSILSADFARLGEAVQAVERGGARAIHADVMDGRFVPNLTMGPALVASLRKMTSLPIDAHLMVEDGDRFIDAFADAGTSWLSLHVEAVPHLDRALGRIRERGMRPGVALNPATSLSLLDEALPLVDFVLVMSVNPGFSGQRFIGAAVEKVRRLRDVIAARGLDVQIEVDGGVDRSNIRTLRDAGASIFVAGAAAFGAGDPEAAVRGLNEALG
jgi:ribulose-phosphate 3-epimerase